MEGDLDPHQIEDFEGVSLPLFRGSKLLLQTLQALVDTLAHFQMNGKPNVAIGIGVPGPIYSEEGVIEDLTNFDPEGSWKMFPIKRVIENAIGAPTFGDNDANCAAIAVILSLLRWGIEIAEPWEWELDKG